MTTKAWLVAAALLSTDSPPCTLMKAAARFGEVASATRPASTGMSQN